MKDNWKPNIAVLGANLIYGLNYTVAKDVMPNFITPFGLVFCRVVGALFLFWCIHLFTFEKVEKKDLLLLAVCGFFGVFANQIMFLYGLDHTTPINASIIMVSNPILVLIASAIILKLRITTLKIGGIAAGITGALLLLLFKKDFSFGSENFLGNLFIFLNAMSYGIYLVIVVPLMRKYKPLTVITWVFTFGIIYVFPVGFHDFLQIKWQLFPPLIWVEFSFIIICTTFFAYLLNIYGLKKLNPTIVSTYIYLQPLIAAFIAIWAGKDRMDWVKIVAAVLIFSGVYLVGKQKTNC
ncbi:MAG: EamA family transporter [Flavobacteriales bacterium CG_4_10_14_0_2_um_filter_32_8]|nr:MAG: EamA family transporter [Flavobacteriales bacterium CG_4_10_14_0_2_um_filter_32_8]